MDEDIERAVIGTGFVSKTTLRGFERTAQIVPITLTRIASDDDVCTACSAAYSDGLITSYRETVDGDPRRRYTHGTAPNYTSGCAAAEAEAEP